MVEDQFPACGGFSPHIVEPAEAVCGGFEQNGGPVGLIDALRGPGPELLRLCPEGALRSVDKLEGFASCLALFFLSAATERNG